MVDRNRQANVDDLFNRAAPGYSMKILFIIYAIIFVVLIGIAAIWIWACYNPGVLYCHNGVLKMSMVDGPLPKL